MSQTDEQLLDAVAVLYAALDPVPDDLADNVLARLAMEHLESEYELLTLTERVDHVAGTRGTDVIASGATGTVALEFSGTTCRLLVRLSTVGGERRLDGWVLPPVPVQVFLGPHGVDAQTQVGQSAEADADGRFEFSVPVTGQVRLWLLPQADDGSAPFVTPPFAV